MALAIIQTIIGCLLGVAVFKVLSGVSPIGSWGEYSTGMLMAICWIMCMVLGQVPVWWGRITNQVIFPSGNMVLYWNDEKISPQANRVGGGHRGSPVGHRGAPVKGGGNLAQKITVINAKLGLQRLSGKEPQMVIMNFGSEDKETMNQIISFYLDPRHAPVGSKIDVFRSDVPRAIKIVQRTVPERHDW